MKNVLSVFLIAFMFALSAPAGDHGLSAPPRTAVEGPLLLAANDNNKAPDFTLRSLQGKEYTLSGLEGKVVLVNFWSSSCMPCIMEMPGFNKLYKKMDGRPFEILALTSDPRSMVENAVEDMELLFPVLLDPSGETARKYSAYNVPITYIIAPDGTVDNKVMGAVNWGDPSVVDYINKLLEEHKNGEEKKDPEK
jgi:peroxiredoxin